MNPTLMAALAAERHADLLRTAEARRRATPLPRRTGGRAPAVAGLARTVVRAVAVAGAPLRSRSAAGLRSPAACCA